MVDEIVRDVFGKSSAYNCVKVSWSIRLIGLIQVQRSSLEVFFKDVVAGDGSCEHGLSITLFSSVDTREEVELGMLPRKLRLKKICLRASLISSDKQTIRNLSQDAKWNG
jgi:hypothetical protein